MYIIYLVFIIKIIIVLIQTIYVLPGTTFDVDNFHLAAVEFSDYIERNKPLSEYNYKHGWIYSVFIGFVYSILGTSKIIGGLLSVLTWLLSAVVLRKVLLLFKLNDYKINLSLLSYVFLFPISSYYTTLMLREVYILLFINLFFLSIVKMSLREKNITKIFYFLLFILTIILLYHFHQANSYFLIIYLSFGLIFFTFKCLKKIITIFEIPRIIWAFLLITISMLFYNHEIFEYIFDTMVNYQIGHFNRNIIFRADYFFIQDRVNLDYSFLTFLKVMYGNIFNYLLQPTPLNVKTFKDLILFTENLIRFLIYIYIIFNLFKSFQMKNIYIFGFAILVIMETIYASGTVNWGAASRHHVPIQGMLIFLMFFPKKKISIY